MVDCELLPDQFTVQFDKSSLYTMRAGSLIPVPDCPGRYCGRTLIASNASTAESCYSNCTVSPIVSSEVSDYTTSVIHMHANSLPLSLSFPLFSSLTPSLPPSLPPSHPLQACPVGYRVDRNISSECLPCEDPAVPRDYFFLGFVCLVCIGVRLSVIATSTVGKPGWSAKL